MLEKRITDLVSDSPIIRGVFLVELIENLKGFAESYAVNQGELQLITNLLMVTEMIVEDSE